MQPQILLLKEGTENAHGKQQVISNINACAAIVDAVSTTLGPRGMDKLIVDNRVRSLDFSQIFLLNVTPRARLQSVTMEPPS